MRCVCCGPGKCDEGAHPIDSHSDQASASKTSKTVDIQARSNPYRESKLSFGRAILFSCFLSHLKVLLSPHSPSTIDDIFVVRKTDRTMASSVHSINLLQHVRRPAGRCRCACCFVGKEKDLLRSCVRRLVSYRRIGIVHCNWFLRCPRSISSSQNEQPQD
jgi:hypothetical protein